MKTKEQALKQLGLEEFAEPTITGIQPEKAEILKAVYDSLIMSEAIREDYVPDYNDENQLKWEPWYYLRKDNSNPSGFRFYDSIYSRTGTHSVLGPLLSQSSSSKSDELGKYMENRFREILTKK